MPDAANQAEEVFFEALKFQNATERTAFLDRACAAEPGLRRAVEKLLAEYAEVERFFDESRPTLSRDAEVVRVLADTTNLREGNDSDADGVVGSRIGPYKVLQRIGEGGCGAVYMAEQEKPVRRRVALKVIKLGMDTKKVIARFEAERQALAMMDHPNIARVLDAGATETGRPYFVMELVRGVKITTYCDEHRLEVRQRLDLFIQICAAIQHAHQKGIVHRDIKPSNILVTMLDGAPMPKVIDFGIAKATGGELLTDKTLFTAYEQFIGTPAYMSPEQAQMSGMDVDTRSDIYSLGVLLYELLTGKTPFEQSELLKSGLDEMRRTLREREPHRPSTRLDGLLADELTQTSIHRQVETPRLKSLLKGDLDCIVMKALEKDRSRRYQTVGGLALDVQRFLDNEPILARPPSRLYRLRKLVRRNQVVFVSSGAVAAALIAGTVVSTWLWLKERDARQRMEAAERQKTDLQRETTRLENLRQTADERRKIAEARTLSRLGKLEQAESLLDEIPRYRAGLDDAYMYRQIGDRDAKQGHWAKALSRFAVLSEINQTTNPEDPREVTLDDFRSAALLADQGEFAEYERLRKNVLARHRGTKDPVIAERVLRICLLTHAGGDLIGAMDRFNELTVNSIESNAKLSTETAAWHAYSLALMAYRRGDYASATNWCGRALDYDRGILCRDVGVELIRAMALAQLGDRSQACAELAASRAAVVDEASRFTVKTAKWQGFWFDWAIARVLLREASSLIEDESAANE